MSLDLDPFLDGWQRPRPGAIAARVVRGMDGGSLLQLRVDLGLLQMQPTGRPDGSRFRGHVSVIDAMRRDARARRELPADVGQEADRELQQFNYRRIAYAGLAECAFERGDGSGGCDALRRAIADIDQCLLIVRTIQETAGGVGRGHVALLPSLMFNRSKLLSRMCEAQGRFEESVEALDAGIGALDELLTRAGIDESLRQHDAGVRFLREAAKRLREKHGIDRTLRERLDDAIAREDFEDAARLRDELERRRTNDGGAGEGAGG